MVVLRNGKMVFEWNAGGVTRDHNHNVYSVTKSVVATLMGIALAEGKVSDTNAPLRSLLPDFAESLNDKRKAGITVDDLLTMRSGFPSARGNKPTGPSRELFQQIHDAPDRVRHILKLGLVEEPGRRFSYNNIDPQLIAAILERSTGKRLGLFANESLFRPLGFEKWEWVFPDKTGLVTGGYGIRLRAIDLAKLGQLYLRKGRWGDKQLLPTKWTQSAVRDLTGKNYGYYWWTDLPFGGHKSYAAKGVRGQLLQVVPELDLVFVVLSHLPPEDLNRILSELKNRYLAKAVLSDKALEPDREGVKMLRQELKKASTYIPAKRRGLPKFRLPRLIE